MEIMNSKRVVATGLGAISPIGIGIEENWEGFFNAVALFRKMARSVGEGLGYDYPERVDREMTGYYRWIRSMNRETANSKDSSGA